MNMSEKIRTARRRLDEAQARLELESLPPGFSGFDDEPDDVSDAPPLRGALRGDVVRVGRTKWLVFRVEDEHNVLVTKHGTSGRKMYKVSDTGSGGEVWQIGGSGQRLGIRPTASGPITR